MSDWVFSLESLARQYTRREDLRAVREAVAQLLMLELPPSELQAIIEGQVRRLTPTPAKFNYKLGEQGTIDGE